eukprot:COSAG02_NODE_306_length_25175_cov_76.540118_20_plen_160_part_00
MTTELLLRTHSSKPICSTAAPPHSTAATALHVRVCHHAPRPRLSRVMSRALPDSLLWEQRRPATTRLQHSTYLRLLPTQLLQTEVRAANRVGRLRKLLTSSRAGHLQLPTVKFKHCKFCRDARARVKQEMNLFVLRQGIRPFCPLSREGSDVVMRGLRA